MSTIQASAVLEQYFQALVRRKASLKGRLQGQEVMPLNLFLMVTFTASMVSFYVILSQFQEYFYLVRKLISASLI